MKKIAFFAIIIILTSCKANKYLPTPNAFTNHMKGAQIKCELLNADIVGEILAINESEIYILDTEDLNNKKYIIKKSEILEAELLIVNKSDKLKTLKILGTLNYLSVLGHGIFTTFSLPTNIAMNTGIITTAAGHQQIIYPDDIPWKQINKFSRFPQGIPMNIELEDIE